MENKRNKKLNNCKCPPTPRAVCRKYSETKSINCKFNPFFVTGFIDGEGLLVFKFIRMLNIIQGEMSGIT